MLAVGTSYGQSTLSDTKGGQLGSISVIENKTENGDLTLKINDGGVVKEAIKITGSTGNVSIAPTGATTTFNGPITLGGNISSGSLSTARIYQGIASGTMSQNSAITIVPQTTIGLVLISARVVGSITCTGMVSFRLDGNNFTHAIVAGSNLNTTTGALTGTTGTSGKCTISSGNDGNLYFENRLANNQVWSFTFMGI
jgi:hypothetical protein